MTLLTELRQERDQINGLIAYLERRQRGGRRAAPHRGDVDALGRRRRTISPAGRARMSAGMRKYWAKRKAAEKS